MKVEGACGMQDRFKWRIRLDSILECIFLCDILDYDIGEFGCRLTRVVGQDLLSFLIRSHGENNVMSGTVSFSSLALIREQFVGLPMLEEIADTVGSNEAAATSQ